MDKSLMNEGPIDKIPMDKAMDAARTQELRGHLDRVLNSETFRKAHALRHLLEYLVTQLAEGESEHIKESVLAVEVFGRRASFDGRTDNIVRVQAHRLRKLLEVYYSEEGKADPVRFLIPRGGYVPRIVAAREGVPAVGELPGGGLPVAGVRALAAPEMTAPRSSRAWLVVPIACFAAGLVTAAFVMSSVVPRANPAKPQGAVAEIWKGIFEPGVRTIVSFTNPIFLRVGNSPAYLLYRGPLSAPPGTEVDIRGKQDDIDDRFVPPGQKLFFNDGWTGTGEVLAVNRLTELSGRFGEKLTVLPSRTLALNEIHGTNVIFLGSPGLNGALAKIGTDAAPFYNSDDGRIVVRRPAPGERSEYSNVKDKVTSQIESCYALLSVLPGIDAGRRVVSSAGIGTWATWGGIDFATSAAGAARLVDGLKKANGGAMPRYYQAVIRVDLIKEMASNPVLVAVRAIP